MSELDEYKELVRKQQAEIADLKEQIAYLTRKIYVSKSERVDPNLKCSKIVRHNLTTLGALFL
ncbi:hypothetical protein AB8P52_02165 [Companilactobacillus pabuli]|uniref:hypothetical protein n=1 Tax=Companilactobacillus pabuli TaxID=2714036 RepID=UPI00351326F5